MCENEVITFHSPSCDERFAEAYVGKALENV